MKFNRTMALFQPVVITLESLEEVAVLWASIGMSSPVSRRVACEKVGITVTSEDTFRVTELYGKLGRIVQAVPRDQAPRP